MCTCVLTSPSYTVAHSWAHIKTNPMEDQVFYDSVCHREFVCACREMIEYNMIALQYNAADVMLSTYMHGGG